MERMRSLLRPRGMTNQSRIRGLAAAGLLFALAGCGTAVATSTPAGTTPATTPPASGAGGAPLSTAAAPETGCASVNQATSAMVTRHLLVREPVNGGTRTYAQRSATKVRALFGDFCAALAHAYVPQLVMHCPADFGISYTGTFHDGQRVLATFAYFPGGCQRVSLTSAGKTRETFLIGKAAAAAPHLKGDFAAVLGLSQSQVYGAPGSQTLGPGKQGV
jgi:hypothetical protein